MQNQLLYYTQVKTALGLIKTLFTVNITVQAGHVIFLTNHPKCFDVSGCSQQIFEYESCVCIVLRYICVCVHVLIIQLTGFVYSWVFLSIFLQVLVQSPMWGSVPAATCKWA